MHQNKIQPNRIMRMRPVSHIRRLFWTKLGRRKKCQFMLRKKSKPNEKCVSLKTCTRIEGVISAHSDKNKK